MGWLIDKIRSWFCKHEWECLVEAMPVYESKYALDIPQYHQWIYVCKKCKRRKKVTTK